MLGKVLNTALIPVYIVAVIFLIVTSLVIRLLGLVADFLSAVCDLVSDMITEVVKSLDKL